MGQLEGDECADEGADCEAAVRHAGHSAQNMYTFMGVWSSSEAAGWPVSIQRIPQRHGDF